MIYIYTHTKTGPIILRIMRLNYAGCSLQRIRRVVPTTVPADSDGMRLSDGGRTCKPEFLGLRCEYESYMSMQGSMLCQAYCRDRWEVSCVSRLYPNLERYNPSQVLQSIPQRPGLSSLCFHSASLDALSILRLSPKPSTLQHLS